MIALNLNFFTNTCYSGNTTLLNSLSVSVCWLFGRSAFLVSHFPAKTGRRHVGESGSEKFSGRLSTAILKITASVNEVHELYFLMIR